MDLLPQLNTGGNWEIIYDESFVRASSPTGAKIPIPVATVGTLFDQHLLIVFPFSSSLPERYYVGGWVSFWTEVATQQLSSRKARIGDSQRLQIDEYNLVICPKISQNYEVRLATPRYVDDIQWQVWQYVGLGEPTVEGKLDSIYDQVIK